jgi:hypothetical protein
MVRNAPGYRTTTGPAECRPAGVSGRKNAGPEELSPQEKRRMLRCLLPSGLSFRFRGADAAARETAALRESALAALERDTDFRAAFASVGEAISGGERSATY